MQSISAKLLEVTRLAEKLDARLCEAGARSRALKPATEDDHEISASEDAKEAGSTISPVKDLEEFGAVLAKNKKTEDQASTRDADRQSRMSDRSVVEDSNVEEYVTATECTTTPVPRSRSESFEYEDVPVSTTCRKAEDETIKKNEVLAVAKCEAVVPANSSNKEVIEYSPDGATVIQRTIQEKGGKVIKEVTETTTLRVSHNTHMGVASFKLVSNTIADHTDNLDYRELQDLNRTILNGTAAPLKTHREEHTYASPTTLVNYHKSIASGLLDVRDETQHEIEDAEPSIEEREFLALAKSVSEAEDECAMSSTSTEQKQHQRIPVACTSVAAAVVEEFAALPATIAVCELN